MAIVKLSNLGAYGLSPAGIKPEEFSRFSELAGFRPRANGLVWGDNAETDVTAGSISSTPDNAGYAAFSGNKGVLMRDDTHKTIDILPAGTAITLTNSGFDADQVAYLGRWQFERFGDGLVINGGFFPPALYLATGDYEKLAAWDSTAFPNADVASCFRVYSERLFAIGVQIGVKTGRNSQRIYYSSVTAPGEQPASFDAADPASGAGYFDLTNAIGTAIDAKVLGGSLIIYCEGSTHAVQYVGGSLLFTQRRIATVGVPFLDCVVDVGGSHVIDSGVDLLSVDGSGAKSILSQEMREIIYASPVDAEDKHLVYRETTNTLYLRADVDWYSGSMIGYYVVDLSTGKVWAEFAESTTLFIQYESASSDKMVRLEANRSGTDTGLRLCDSVIGDYYRFKAERLNFGTMDHKVIDGVRFIAEASPKFDSAGCGVDVTVTGYDAVGNQLSADTLTTPGDTQDDGWLRCEVYGVFFTILVVHDSTSTTELEIHEIEIDVTTVGEAA